MAIFDPSTREHIDERLRGMRLELGCFEQSLAAGAAEAASYSEGAPAAAPELGRWMRTVEEFHHSVLGLQRGWERTDPLNQPTWINPELHIAIVVSSGDENTGQRTFKNPTNRNPKGSSFGALVAANEARFFDTVTRSGDMVGINETWVFLYDARAGSVFSELSLPVLMPGSFIENWHHRILLPRFDDSTNLFETVPDAPVEQDYTFVIERR